MIHRPFFYCRRPKSPHPIGNRRLFADGMGTFRVKAVERHSLVFLNLGILLFWSALRPLSVPATLRFSLFTPQRYIFIFTRLISCKKSPPSQVQVVFQGTALLRNLVLSETEHLLMWCKKAKQTVATANGIKKSSEQEEQKKRLITRARHQNKFYGHETIYRIHAESVQKVHVFFFWLLAYKV